jgi:hypothetical protein
MAAILLPFPPRRPRLQVVATPGSAMARAFAAIDRAFSGSAEIQSFKRRIRYMIELGTGHHAVRARYGARTNMLRGRDLDAAIILVNRWHAQERKAFQIASAFGRGDRLSIEVLRELRVILRLLRASKYRDRYVGILAFVLDEGRHDYSDTLAEVGRAMAEA